MDTGFDLSTFPTDPTERTSVDDRDRLRWFGSKFVQIRPS